MSNFKYVLVAGFAMFSMFFGSGNLVFPLWVGVETTSQFLVASLGLMVTAILLPFLGLLSMTMFNGDRREFFSHVGKWPALLLSFSMLCLMGPFGVMPRCLIVGYGGVKLMFPDLSMQVFNALSCVAIAVMVWRPNRIVDLLGKVLTPVLLLGIVVISVMGLAYGPDVATSSMASFEAFEAGLSQGYQTMDLLAAFFFAAAAVNYLKTKTAQNSNASLVKMSVVACVIGASLLAIVYGGFVSLGAKFSHTLAQVSPESMLVMVAKSTLGDFAVPIAGSTIALACLTTAVVLTTLFADFLTEDLSGGRIPRKVSVIITLVIGYVISLLGFMKIAAWIQQSLMLAYPALMVLAISNILYKVKGWNFGLWPFWGVLGATVLLTYLM